MEEGKLIDSTYAIFGRYLMVKMPAELDHHNATSLRIKTDEFIMDNKVDHVVFDFEDTAFMDSSGIGVLMGRYKKLSLFGGTVSAIHVKPRIRKIMEMSGVNSFVEIISETGRK
ncbi:MAG: anti-sigma factor antagonist [Lachnospiraceae bacterium]|nr:anti-sigma factor antagonist [Lachnospiraceae bacterium]